MNIKTLLLEMSKQAPIPVLIHSRNSHQKITRHQTLFRPKVESSKSFSEVAFMVSPIWFSNHRQAIKPALGRIHSNSSNATY